MLRFLAQALIFLMLTILTQIGGLAWLFALWFRRRLVVFMLAYAALALSATWIAPQFGRVALSCTMDGPLQVQSVFYCALNRTYVTPDLRDVLVDVAAKMDSDFPGTQTLVLDGSFPFLDGFPLLPHLSHDDGEKVDLAFFYRDESGYLPGKTRSPIGFFAFEQGPTHCTLKWPSMRWDLDLLQPLWRDYTTDPARNAAILRHLAGDTRVGKIFVEPHVLQRWGVSHPKIRFQGCRAARHDDHIHLQLR
ncbi:MAG: hypothetical protein AAFZ04_00700 [Pseudomonadota bacterium]